MLSIDKVNFYRALLGLSSPNLLIILWEANYTLLFGMLFKSNTCSTFVWDSQPVLSSERTKTSWAASKAFIITKWVSDFISSALLCSTVSVDQALLEGLNWHHHIIWLRLGKHARWRLLCECWWVNKKKSSNFTACLADSLTTRTRLQSEWHFLQHEKLLGFFHITPAIFLKYHKYYLIHKLRAINLGTTSKWF